jgi:hypothetical protein
MYDDGNNSTYLEDFLLSLETLPNKFRRDLELVRDFSSFFLSASYCRLSFSLKN